MDNDQINKAYHGEIFTEEGQRRTRERIHWLVEQARGKTVLDVGCSQGITSILLGRKGFTCLGVDIAPDQIDYAKHELEKEAASTRERVRFELMDARDVRGGPFDTIILGQVLEHDRDPEGLIVTVLRLLSHDGRLLISVPYGHQPPADHHRSFFFDNLYNLLESRVTLSEFRLLNRFLVAIATPQRSKQPFSFDRRIVTTIEEILNEVQQETYDLKERLVAAADGRAATAEKLAAKADEAKVLKGKLSARATEVKTVKAKLNTRTDELKTITEKLTTRIEEVQTLKRKLAARTTEVKTLKENLKTLRENLKTKADEVQALKERLKTAYRLPTMARKAAEKLRRASADPGTDR